MERCYARKQQQLAQQPPKQKMQKKKKEKRARKYSYCLNATVRIRVRDKVTSRINIHPHYNPSPLKLWTDFRWHELSYQNVLSYILKDVLSHPQVPSQVPVTSFVDHH